MKTPHWLSPEGIRVKSNGDQPPAADGLNRRRNHADAEHPVPQERLPAKITDSGAGRSLYLVLIVGHHVERERGVADASAQVEL